MQLIYQGHTYPQIQQKQHTVQQWDVRPAVLLQQFWQDWANETLETHYLGLEQIEAG